MDNECAAILADLCTLASEINDHTEQSLCAAVLRLANRARATTQQANKGDERALVGWKLVPIEPTRAMRKAGQAHTGAVSATYRDMVAAAPSASSARAAAPQAVTLSDEQRKTIEVAAARVESSGKDADRKTASKLRALLAVSPRETEQQRSDRVEDARSEQEKDDARHGRFT